MYLLTGILAALFEARGSGRGQVVDAAIVDGVAHLTTMIVALQRAGAWSGQRGTNLLDGGAPFYDVYETSDGLHVSVGALEPRFYAELIERLELDDLPDRYDFAGFGRLREVFASAFAQKTQADWVRIFDGSDACVSPVVALADAPAHPHLAARETSSTPGSPSRRRRHASRVRRRHSAVRRRRPERTRARRCSPGASTASTS